MANDTGVTLIELIEAHAPILEAILAGTTPWSRTRLALRATCRAAARVIAPPPHVIGSDMYDKRATAQLYRAVAYEAARVGDVDLIMDAPWRADTVDLVRYFKWVTRGYYATTRAPPPANLEAAALRRDGGLIGVREGYLFGTIQGAAENNDAPTCERLRTLCTEHHQDIAGQYLLAGAMRGGNRATCELARQWAIAHASGWRIICGITRELKGAVRARNRAAVLFALERDDSWVMDTLISLVVRYGAVEMCDIITARGAAPTAQLLRAVANDFLCTDSARFIAPIAAWYREAARDPRVAAQLDYVALRAAAQSHDCEDAIR